MAEWRAEVGTELSGDTREGFAQQLRWERRLYDAGWSAVSWPAAYGGRDGSLWDWLIFEEEYWRAGAPQRVIQNGLQILAPSIFEHGTTAQKDRLLPRIAAARDLWCQGWSEPNAGSDLAAVSSRADRVADGWVLDGQKTWTTRGAFCTHLFGLFRSDPASSRHRGLTYLLVPLDLGGITVRGFGRLDGGRGLRRGLLRRGVPVRPRLGVRRGPRPARRRLAGGRVRGQHRARAAALARPLSGHRRGLARLVR